MRYGIEFVCDEAMPDGEDFVVVQCADWTVTYYRESAVNADLIRQGWAAIQVVAPGLLVPTPGLSESDLRGRALSADATPMPPRLGAGVSRGRDGRRPSRALHGRRVSGGC